MPLEKELEAFKKNLPEWSQTHGGKFVLVVGEELVGVYDDPETAYEIGIERFGNIPMLIKQVLPDEGTVFFPALMLGLTPARSEF
jgi:hypothetical protein